MSGPPWEVYFDFDNTITEFDVLDDLIQRFSINEDWKVAEEQWESGAIGSKECLERQLAGVRIGADALGQYLGEIRIDRAFPPLAAWLRDRGIEPVIVSDSFLPIIRPILERCGVSELPVYANDLALEGDRPRPRFPHFHSICSRSANCKCSHLFRRGRPPETQKIYVGDGRSDICPAGACEILFAKSALLRHYSGRHPRCVPFESLGSVHDALRDLIS